MSALEHKADPTFCHVKNFLNGDFRPTPDVPTYKKPRTERGFLIDPVLSSGFLSTSRQAHSSKADAEQGESGGFGDGGDLEGQ